MRWSSSKTQLGRDKARCVTIHTMWRRKMWGRQVQITCHTLKFIISLIIKPWLMLHYFFKVVNCVPLRVLSHFHQHFFPVKNLNGMCVLFLSLVFLLHQIMSRILVSWALIQWSFDWSVLFKRSELWPYNCLILKSRSHQHTHMWVKQKLY